MHTQHGIWIFPPEEYQRLGNVGIIRPSPNTKSAHAQIYDPANQENDRFTTDEYFRMGKLGILPSSPRTELLYGQIYEMSPSGPTHGGIVTYLQYLLMPLYGNSVTIRVEKAIVIPHHSAPEPDIALVRPRDDFYTASHPEPSDALLLIEVMDSSRSRDMKIKPKLYAEAGIPELWVIDLRRDRLLVHRNPTNSGYADVKPHSSGRIVALEIPDVNIEIDDLLGRSIKSNIQRLKTKTGRKR